MLDAKNCLKISYHGEEKFIICEAGSTYEEIIAKAGSRFHIPESQQAGLVLTNGQGYEFDRHLLEYFLLLFPCPELPFQLRIDWQKLRRALAEPVKRRRSADDLVDFQSRSTTDDTDYVAVPVHRQNCFIGVLPSNDRTAAAAAAARRENCLLREQQLLQGQQSAAGTLHRAKPHLAGSQSQSKRIRMQLPYKSRRTVPSTGPHSPLLATTTRSIRI